MSLPEQLMLLNLQRDELEGRLREVNEEFFIWARNESTIRWAQAGAHTAQFILHGRHEGYDEAAQKVTKALQQDVEVLTGLLATLETTR